jgi:hypothetical protein
MTDENKNKPGITPIKGVLATVLRQCRGDLQWDPDNLDRIWKRAVGPQIASNARPAAFKPRLWIVHVSSSVWLQELHYQKAELIDRVNLEAGNHILDDLQFRIGPLEDP